MLKIRCIQTEELDQCIGDWTLYYKLRHYVGIIGYYIKKLVVIEKFMNMSQHVRREYNISKAL